MNKEKTKNFFKIIKKVGDWQIEINKESLRIKICNDYFSEWPTFFSQENSIFTWSCDTPEILPNSIKKYLFENSKKLHEIQTKLFYLRNR